MSHDPVATLRPCAVDVTLGEWEYTIPVLPAARWIEAILDTDGLAIVPGLLGDEDRRDVSHQYLVGNLDKDEIAKAAVQAVGAAAGRPWWEAVRLVISATGETQWPVISGELFRRGVDLDQISLGAFCNAVYALAVANATEQDRQRLDLELSMLPPDVDPDEVYDEDEETAAFERDLHEMGA